MTASTKSLPLAGSSDLGGAAAPYAYAPGTGPTPLRGGTANTVNEGTLGPVTLTQLLTEFGGTAYKNCAAATAVSVKSGAGRLCKVIVLATGTAAVSIYDNTAASGTVVFTVPANAAAGTIYDLYVPTTLGIYVGGTTNTPQLLTTYY